MLIVFDIDGTLTRTVDLDTEAFSTAFLRTFGLPLPSLDWSTYRNATESGVVAEAAEAVRGQAPSAVELQRMQDEFVRLLDEAMAGLPAEELQMPGAVALLDRLLEAGHAIALATGCWHASARSKLGAAGLHLEHLPLATADDSIERKVILALAAHRAGYDPADRHVYVGDGVWDASTSAALGWSFIGVGAPAGRLATTGVQRLVEHFGDLAAFEACLASCEAEVRAS